MAQIFEIAVERSRTAQVKDYEPSAAKVSLKASVEDGEDWQKVTRDLLDSARDEVYNSLGLKLPAKTGQESTTQTSNKSSSGTGTGKKRGRPSNKEKAAQEEKDKQEEDKSSNETDDIPDDIEPTPNPSEDVPNEPETDEAPDEAVDQAYLTEFVTTIVQNKQLKPAKVKEILSKYNAERVRDLEEKDYVAFKNELEKELKE